MSQTGVACTSNQLAGLRAIQHQLVWCCACAHTYTHSLREKAPGSAQDLLLLTSSSEDPLEDDLEDEDNGQRDPVFGQKPLPTSSPSAADVLHLQPHHLLLQAAQCLGRLLLHLDQGVKEQCHALLGQLHRLACTAPSTCGKNRGLKSNGCLHSLTDGTGETGEKSYDYLYCLVDLKGIKSGPSQMVFSGASQIQGK